MAVGDADLASNSFFPDDANATSCWPAYRGCRTKIIVQIGALPALLGA
jgi:hypothetical protein